MSLTKSIAITAQYFWLSFQGFQVSKFYYFTLFTEKKKLKNNFKNFLYHNFWLIYPSNDMDSDSQQTLNYLCLSAQKKRGQ